jgi:SAM-dependent methyltransferase
MESLLSGESLEDVLPRGALTQVHEFLGQLDRREFIQMLSHSKPNLRILEIGTGNGVSLHRDILAELTRPDGEVLCAKYTLTAPGYVVATTQEKIFPNMEFASLDISEDPFEQGFEEGGYDLIIAVNALHGCKNIQESLVNLRKLLRFDGRLLLQELCPSSRWLQYVLGALPTWWSGPADVEAPYLGQEEWKSKLAAAAFGDIEAMALDSEEPHQVTTTMVVKQVRETPMKKVTVLLEEEGPAVTHILSELEKEGYQVTRCRLEDEPPAGQDVISLLDVEQPFFHELDEPRFLAFKAFLLGLQDRDAGMLWATHLIDIGCRDPRYAQVLGLARTIRTEQLADLGTCQIDSFDNPKSIGRFLQVLAKFQTRQGDDELNPDFEWAIFNGQVQVARFHPFILADELLVSEESNEMATLNVRTPGRVNSLHYARHERKNPEKDEVEVEVYSAGLNFRVSQPNQPHQSECHVADRRRVGYSGRTGHC